MALLGLGAIAEALFGKSKVTVHWSGGMAPRPVLEVEGMDLQEIAEAVRAHACAAAAPDSWLSARHPDQRGTRRGLMSPRRARPAGDAGMRLLVEKRREVIDRLTRERAVLDLRMLGGLGEPSHWHVNRKGEPYPEAGASRFDMQARNQGSELVATKLTPLASAVSGRTADAVLSGLCGRSLRDDISGERTDGLTATGLAPAGPFDSALAWCALWGIIALPVAPRAHVRSTTTGTLDRPERFVMAVVDSPIRPARMRSILADARLLSAIRAEDGLTTLEAERWLIGRSVRALVVFPVDVGGSANAPLRSARLGVVHPIGGR
jgi:CRISPR-associated protein Csb3